MGARKSIAERNVAAEARAVECGHRAYVQDGGWVKVVSDTYDGKWYHVTAAGHSDALISFDCRPEGRMAYKDDHLAASTELGVLPCMHAALAARALERHGLAVLDEHGRWAVAPKVHAEAMERIRAQLPANPLEGLPL